MRKFKKRILLFFYGSLLIVLVSFGVIFLNFRKQMIMQDEIIGIEATLRVADSLQNNLLQIESDKRGFVLTNDVSYLDNFYMLKKNCQQNVAVLKNTNLASKEQKSLMKIDSLMKIRLANLDSGIMVSTTKGFEAAKQYMQLLVNKYVRVQLTENLELLKTDLLERLKLTTASIHSRGHNNRTGLIIVLIIFIALMITASRTFKSSQQKMIKNHRKFQEAQRIARIGSWEWDIKSGKVYWSNEQFRLYGEDKKTFVPTLESYMQHLSEKDQMAMKQLLKDVLGGKSPLAVEHEILRGDGSKIIVFEQGTVLYDDQKNPVGMFGTSQDVTERKQTEKELMMAQQRIQSIFDNAADGIYQSTIDGRFIMVNPAMARMFGYRGPSEMVATISDISKQMYANRSDRSRMAELLAQQDHVKNFEAQLLTKQGNRIWVSESTRAVRNDKGAIVYFEGTLKDITAEKKAIEEMMLARKRYQDIFDNTADGIYQSTTDGRFIMVNPSMARIFRYDSPEEMMQLVTNIGTQLYADPHERKKMADLIRTQGSVENYELEVLTKQQETIWVSLNIRCIRNEKDEITLFEGTLEDISIRKQAEAQLLNLSNRLQLAARATGIGIWDWDIIQNVTVWDDEMYNIYGVDIHSVMPISESWAKAVHPEDLARVNLEVQQAIRGEKEYDTEFRVIWEDKSVHHVKGHAIVLKDAEGKAIRMIGTNADITLRKEAEEEILQLNRSLDQFANITAHDLQEPIRMVSGFLGLLDKKYNEVIDETGRSYIYRAKDGADRMSILIRDLLEFSRSGNTAAKKNHVDLAHVMDLVDKDLSIVMADTGARLRFPETMPVVFGTQSALYRLFLNLVSNGIKFRKKDVAPEVTVRVEEHDSYWEFSVQDNGIGVQEKDQPKLFQAFQRLHRRDEYPGTGLGLVTCKKIVETHGGRIWMTSEFGVGTTFHFTVNKVDDAILAA